MSHDLVFPIPVVLYAISLYFSSVMSHDPAFPVPGVFFSFVPAIILAVFFFILVLAFSILFAAHVAVVVLASAFGVFPATVAFSFLVAAVVLVSASTGVVPVYAFSFLVAPVVPVSA